ncbi:unnamed protein product [Parnassius apollo]|uniref:(apollo) hypothetical protein n=1 Tax=Parnassius apollo TaxID=110799 RepID=A0A8S3VZS7_PARAO|nr:unnamed protein product [Parnassius apollo]
MGAISLPQIRHYWSTHNGINIVKKAMTRRRFFTIRISLKIVYDADVSEEEKTNEIWKVAPLFDAILRGCRTQQKMGHISIDEMIIPFSGHCGIRQYCPGKPNPVGIKVFVLANLTGYDISRSDSTRISDV